jgi:hypothetical protein
MLRKEARPGNRWFVTLLSPDSGRGSLGLGWGPGDRRSIVGNSETMEAGACTLCQKSGLSSRHSGFCNSSSIKQQDDNTTGVKNKPGSS